MFKRYIYLFYIHIAIVLFGSSGLFAKWIQLPASDIILGRSLVALPFLALLCLLSKSKMPHKVPLKDKGLIMLSGVLMTTHWVTIYAAIQVSTIGIGVIAMMSYPLLTSLIEPFVKKQPFKVRHLIESICLMVGVGILMNNNPSHGQVGLGIAIGLMSGLSFACRNIIMTKITHTYSSTWLMFTQVGISIICLLPVSWPMFQTASVTDAWLMVLSGILLTFIGQTLLLKSLQYITASTMGIVASFELVYSVVAGWWILHEPITVSIVIGGSIIAITVAYEQTRLFKEEAIPL